MIDDPDRYLEAFVKAGAAMVTVHAEVVPHLHRTLTRIRELGARGRRRNQSGDAGRVGARRVAGEMDHLLVMSVNPGFSGQTFIPHSIEKVAAARALLARARQRRGHRGRRRRRQHQCRRARAGRRDDPRGRRRRLRRRRSRPRPPARCGDGREWPPNVAMPSSITTLRVRYAETDQMGVVYYANYFVWFEVARAELLRTLGWTYREMEAAACCCRSSRPVASTGARRATMMRSRSARRAAALPRPHGVHVRGGSEGTTELAATGRTAARGDRPRRAAVPRCPTAFARSFA